MDLTETLPLLGERMVGPDAMELMLIARGG